MNLRGGDSQSEVNNTVRKAPIQTDKDTDRKNDRQIINMDELCKLNAELSKNRTVRKIYHEINAWFSFL